MIVRIRYKPIRNQDDDEMIEIAVKITLVAIEELIGYIPPFNLHGKRKIILNVGCLSQIEANRVYEMLSKEENQGIIEKVQLLKKTPYETDVGKYISVHPEPKKNEDGSYNYGWCMGLETPLRIVMQSALDIVEKKHPGETGRITRAVVLWYSLIWKDELEEI